MSDEDSESNVTELQIGEDNELPVIQLVGLVEELSYGNSALKTETEMFEKYYNKLEAKEPRFSRLSEIKAMGTEFAQFRGRHKSKSRIDRLIGLSVDQKLELVQKELEDTKDDIRHMRANAERDLQHHEAVIQEAEIRWTEIQRAMYEFEKDILKTISRKKGSILATQKILKYIDDVNHRRSKLNQAMEMTSNLEKEILLRNELLEKIEKETIQVEEDRAKAEAANQRLRKQLVEFRAPPVMMYVHEKIMNGDLEKTIKMWERKVEIAEMSLKGYRKAWNKMKTTNEELQEITPLGNSQRKATL
ncbi:Coiled-coil domain-containing protein 113 [Galemys pyrenaicus]|uniref:Cilia- and flagella-associated protein 263 n=1 Tax=Galemys pyrenaicus TaxID=202257 RepID=A0A8J6AZL6_GALPY|nr:Coiled-coil domain-containing protein 113 [Galemys pyrenaicus]